MTKILAAFSLALMLALLAAGCRLPPIQWNATAIDWHDYEDGLARAKAEHKPILLVFYADWCAPCHEYHEHVFSDPRIIAHARDFVMVRVNADGREDLYAKKFHAEGLPSTYFLNPDGVLLKGARTRAMCGRYGYDHKDPASLLAGMDQALKLAGGPPDDDPLALKPEACAAKATSPCAACTLAHCCVEMIACINDPGCICTKTPRGASGAEAQALTACLKDQCPQCPAG